jgi:hypothetical protein
LSAARQPEPGTEIKALQWRVSFGSLSLFVELLLLSVLEPRRAVKRKYLRMNYKRSVRRAATFTGSGPASGTAAWPYPPGNAPGISLPRDIEKNGAQDVAETQSRGEISPRRADPRSSPSMVVDSSLCARSLGQGLDLDISGCGTDGLHCQVAYSRAEARATDPAFQTRPDSHFVCVPNRYGFAASASVRIGESGVSIAAGLEDAWGNSVVDPLNRRIAHRHVEAAEMRAAEEVLV